MVNLNPFRRRNDQQAHRIVDKPDRERHYVSIIGSILSGILLIVCLCLRQWANGSSKDCDFVFGLTEVSCMTGDGHNTISSESYFSNLSVVVGGHRQCPLSSKICIHVYILGSWLEIRPPVYMWGSTTVLVV